ncbi:site-2 protease family protein [Candidatus Gracilibacteria bacterium]|nr:site-2 protease family protein [Candidatus Gracilibacteria bacterium]
MILLSILAFIVIFSSLILIHEAGHFFAAKKSGVKVLEFGLGFGKKIYGKQVGETEFTINAIPFGGFVRMEGEEEASNDPRSFRNVVLWKQMIITLAGVFMNFVFAILLLSILFSLGTNPILISKNDYIKAYESGALVLQNKDGSTFASVETFPSLDDAVESAGDADIKMTFVQKIKKPFLKALPFAFTETFRISWAVVEKVSEIPIEIIENHKLPDGMAGPLGIAEVTHKVVPLGILALLKLAALLSISLGVMNLLPIPALDGGRFFFQILALLLMPFKIKHSEKLEEWAHVGGYFLLMGFLLVVTWNDIVRIFFL